MTKRTFTYLERRRMEDLGRSNSWQPHGMNPDARVWNDDWTPDRVAVEIGQGCSGHHVRGFYRTIGLDIKADVTQGNPVDRLNVSLLRERVESLEKDLQTALARIAALESDRKIATFTNRPNAKTNTRPAT